MERYYYFRVDDGAALPDGFILLTTFNNVNSYKRLCKVKAELFEKLFKEKRLV